MQNKLFGTQYDPTVHDPPLMIASPKNCESTSQPMKDAPAHMQNTAVTTTKMLRAQSWLRFCSWDCGLPSDRQGCGLGLDVSVSRRIPTSRLGLELLRLVPIPADRNSKNPAPAFTCRFSVPSFKVAVGVLSDGGGLCHTVLVTWASRLSDVKSATSFIAVIKLALVVARAHAQWPAHLF